MEPSFAEGDVAVFVGQKKYLKGDVVLANINGREVIKRIATIDGSTAYLLGDNTVHSTDSREYGAVSLEYIKGKCVQKLSFGWLTAKKS
jgi:phage repressor protein C with HTH and peptisase S24 domain